MENPAATIYCSNPRCQAPNPQSNKFCQQCRTPILRRYLWTIGQGIEAFKAGDVIAGRYVVVHSRILLDTQPGMPPETPLDIPASIAPYLRLAPYALHLPQVYGRLLPDGRSRSEIWLLEEAPLYNRCPEKELGKGNEAVEGLPLPDLASAWNNAPAMRQLNWLWQIALLWQPFSSEGVASSLLSPSLLRVEGSLVRLLELRLDAKSAPTLQQLGQLWTKLLPGASPSIAEFLQQLCTQLSNGQIRSSEQLLELLDGALKDSGRWQVRSYQVFTRTDSGPSRPHNEDACYPPSGQLVAPSQGSGALAIVCDGIGGHEGGEVASHLAINTLREQVEPLPNDPDSWNPTTLTLELERAACAANDIISQQNDTERRSDRQRMGTTLVMARTAAHEIYITHVGDSRVYWITRHNCHQVTLDDDLASREVRLGYALYRNALQQPTSGSLVQALGMAPSATLHPTVQRFVLDEDCVFLLCSDGLSDNDRVEQHWQTEILPILDGKIDLPRAGARLIEIANTQNGHDNATIALIYCKVSPDQRTGQTQLSPIQTAIPTPPAEGTPTLLASAAPSHMKTQQLSPTASKPVQRNYLGLLLAIVVLLGLGGVVASILVGGFDRLMSYLPLPDTTGSEPQADTKSPPANSAPISTAKSAPESAEWIQVKGKSLSLWQQSQSPSTVAVIAPAGSILYRVAEYRDPNKDVWLQLKVCSPDLSKASPQTAEPAQAVSPSPLAPAGQSPTTASPKQNAAHQVTSAEFGWIRKAELRQKIKEQALVAIDPNIATPAQLGKCPPPTPPTATPTSPSAPIQAPGTPPQ
jgi:serine/threonine protein phosphatase PrpC